MSKILNRFIRWTALASLPTGMLILTTPNYPAIAGNDFSDCIGELVANNIAGDKANVACAEAFKPREISGCVQKISSKTSIASEDALNTCFRVRRPMDLASCVVDIHENVIPNQNNKEEQAKTSTTNSTSSLALDTCRRSLLPGRFSECVTAVNGSSQNASPEKAMDTCISAEDFPRELYPTSSSQ